MPTQDYESFRQELERQLRADVELLYEAYRVKLRAYETVCRARGELEGGSWESRPADLPPLLPLPSEPAAPVLRQAAPPPPAPLETAPALPKAEPAAVYYDLVAALERVGEEFDKRDLLEALGYEPRRATLYRALMYLEEDKKIALIERGSGRQASRYRRLDPVAASREPEKT